MDNEKSGYMTLEDFQTLWTGRIKPAIPALNGAATVQEATAAAEELT